MDLVHELVDVLLHERLVPLLVREVMREVTLQLGREVDRAMAGCRPGHVADTSHDTSLGRPGDGARVAT